MLDLCLMKLVTIGALVQTGALKSTRYHLNIECSPQQLGAALLC
jgi:hypothetical protein